MADVFLIIKSTKHRKEGRHMKSKKPIMKQLNKKARPDGLMNFKFVISKVGERDYKNSQLPGVVACACNPNTLGGQGRRIA